MPRRRREPGTVRAPQDDAQPGRIQVPCKCGARPGCVCRPARFRGRHDGIGDAHWRGYVEDETHHRSCAVLRGIVASDGPDHFEGHTSHRDSDHSGDRHGRSQGHAPQRKGEEDTYTAGPVIARFSELKVGDRVRMTYYESTVYQVRKPGEVSNPTSVEAAVTPPRAPCPVGRSRRRNGEP